MSGKSWAPKTVVSASERGRSNYTCTTTCADRPPSASASSRSPSFPCVVLEHDEVKDDDGDAEDEHEAQLVGAPRPPPLLPALLERRDQRLRGEGK